MAVYIFHHCSDLVIDTNLISCELIKRNNDQDTNLVARSASGS
jgi:hypothetical protein